MGKYRDYDQGDVFYASTVDAMMEATSTLISGLRLRITSNTVISATAGSDSAQVGVALNGLWRWRTSSFSAAHPGGSAGVFDILVTCSANDFTGVGSDPDATDYNWSMAIVTTGSSISGPSIAEYRKVGECDWDGSKITALRQTVGLGDGSASVAPTADVAGQTPVTVRLAASQTAPAIDVKNSGGTSLTTVSSAGAISAPSVTLTAATGDDSVTLSNRSKIAFADSGTKATVQLSSGGALEITNSTNSRVTLSSGSDLTLRSGSSSGSVVVGGASAEKVGFFGSTGAVRSSGWTASNVTTDKSFDASSTTLNETANVLGTLINSLKDLGLLGS